jgi:hypothetical protein
MALRSGRIALLSMALAPLAPSPAFSPPETVYLPTDPAAGSRLRIIGADAHALVFEFTRARGLDGKVTGRLRGTATRGPAGDSEFIQDEAENAHEAEDFLHRSGTCTLQIRLAADDSGYAQVFEEGCGRFGLHEAPYGADILYRRTSPEPTRDRRGTRR